MLESGSSGSVRGVLSNEHPYREPRPIPEVARTVAAMSQLGRKNIAKTYMALSPR